MVDSRDIPRFSLKQLLVTSAVVSAVLAIGLMFGYGPASTLVLGLGIWLTWAGLRGKRELRTAIGVPLIYAGGTGVFLALMSWLVFGVGPIFLPESYPADVRRIIAVAQADPWQTKVYRHDKGMSFFLEHVSRLEVSQSQVDTIVSTFNLAGVEAHEIDPSFWQKFPRHWRPRPTSELRFYKGTLDMARYDAVYEPSSACFYVWCIEDYN